MKLTLDSKAFVEAVAWVTKNYDAKDTKAYVSLSVAEDGKAIVSHESRSSYIQTELALINTDFSGDSVNKADLALDGRFLQRLSGALSGTSGEIVLSKKLDSNKTVDDMDDFEDEDSHEEIVGKSTPLQVKTSSGTFTVPVFHAAPSKQPKIVEFGEVLEVELFDSLQRVAKLTDVANASVLPALGCVDIRLSAEDETLSMMTTDRFAMSEITLDFAPTDNGELENHSIDILLPYDSAITVPASKNTGDSVKVVYAPKTKKFGFSFTDGRIALFSLESADPLEYKPLIEHANETVEHSMIVSTNDLKKAVANVSNLSWEENMIWMNISESGDLTVTDQHQTNVQKVEGTDAEIEGDFRVSFNRAVLNKAFSPISTSRVQLRWLNESKQFCFSLVLDDDTIADNVFILVQPSVEND